MEEGFSFLQPAIGAAPTLAKRPCLDITIEKKMSNVSQI